MDNINNFIDNNKLNIKLESKKIWNSFFNNKDKVRWDYFEDFLTYLYEIYILENPKYIIFEYYIKNLFLNIHYKLSSNTDSILFNEIPKIPLKDQINEEKKIISIENYLDFFKIGINNVIENDFKELSKNFNYNFEELDIENKILYKYKNSKNIEREYIDGTIFKGNYLNNKKEGNGILYLKNKTIKFKGNFINGERNGNCEIDINQEINKFKIYCKFKNDYKHGNIIFKTNNNYSFEGKYKNNEKFYGKFIWNDKNYYVGFWKNDKFNNEGYYLNENELYEGIFNESKYEGFGKYENKEMKIISRLKENLNENNENNKIIEYQDKKYIGKLFNNKEEGYGIMIFNDGTIYKGNWKNGLYHGEGNLKTNLDNYLGEFKFGKKDGNGILKMFNGEIKGIFKDNEFIEGEMNYPEGFWINKELGYIKHYKGHLKNNLFDGNGKLIFFNGKEYNGEFKEGKIKGKGNLIEVHNKDIIKYTGLFDENKLNGFGEMYKNDQLIYSGNWKNGKKFGYGKILNENSKNFENTLFIDNKKLNLINN